MNILITYYIVNVYDNKNPISIIKLAENNVLKSHMKAVLGVGELNARFRASRNTVSYLLPENNEILRLDINSCNQMTEFDILYRSCDYIIKKMSDIKKDLINKFNNNEIEIKTETSYVLVDKNDIIIDMFTDKNSIDNPNNLKVKEIKVTLAIIVLIGIDHTLGDVLNDKIQNHTDTLCSGFVKDDGLIKTSRIKLKVLDDKIMKVFTDSIDELIDIYNYIGLFVTNLNKK